MDQRLSRVFGKNPESNRDDPTRKSNLNDLDFTHKPSAHAPTSHNISYDIGSDSHPDNKRRRPQNYPDEELLSDKRVQTTIGTLDNVASSDTQQFT